jgi:hypothetical protein
MSIGVPFRDARYLTIATSAWRLAPPVPLARRAAGQQDGYFE